MDLNTLYLNALTRQAGKLPDDALPHLGTLAHLDLWLSARSRRLFHRAIAGIFGYGAENHKRGMQQLLSIRELDRDLDKDLVQEANRLRGAVSLLERETVRKFFRALRKATVLREYYGLILDRFEAEGEDVMWSIFDGTAFLEVSHVMRQIEQIIDTQSRLAPASPVPEPFDVPPSSQPLLTHSSDSETARRPAPTEIDAAHPLLSQDTTGLWHSPDYRVCKDSAGTVQFLSKEVAKLIETFNVCLKEGVNELAYDTLLERAKTLSEPSLAAELDMKQRYPQRLDHLLRRAKVWKRLVEPGTRRGWYRLKL